MSSSKRVGTHQVPMVAHLGKSEAARLADRIKSLKSSLVKLKKREAVLRRARTQAVDFTSRFPTTSAADAYMQMSSREWPLKRTAINDPHNPDTDPARHLRRDTQARFGTPTTPRMLGGRSPAPGSQASLQSGSRASPSQARGLGSRSKSRGSALTHSAKGVELPAVRGASRHRTTASAPTGEQFDGAVASALSWLAAPATAWGSPHPSSVSSTVQLPAVGAPPGQARAPSRERQPSTRQDREEQRSQLHLRPASVSWPHPLCVAPASELSVRCAQHDRVAAQVAIRERQLATARARRKQLQEKVRTPDVADSSAAQRRRNAYMLGATTVQTAMTQTQAKDSHFSRVLGSIDTEDSGEEQPPATRRRRRRRRKRQKHRKPAPKPRAVVVVPARDAHAHTAFADGDLDFVEPCFAVFDGKRQNRRLEGDASKSDVSSLQARVPKEAQPNPPLDAQLADLVEQLFEFAATTAFRAASLLAKHPFQMRFLANQGAPAPAVRRLMHAVLTLLGSLPEEHQPRSTPPPSPASSCGDTQRRPAAAEDPVGEGPGLHGWQVADHDDAWDDSVLPQRGHDEKARRSTHAGSQRVTAASSQRRLDFHIADWVNASDCLKHPDFAKVFLTTAARLAMLAADSALAARKKRGRDARDAAMADGLHDDLADEKAREAEEDTNHGNGWPAAVGTWRVPGVALEVICGHLDAAEMQEVRGASKSFHGPTAQVLLLWLKAVVTMLHAAAVLRSEPGSYERLFGSEALRETLFVAGSDGEESVVVVTDPTDDALALLPSPGEEDAVSSVPSPPASPLPVAQQRTWVGTPTVRLPRTEDWQHIELHGRTVFECRGTSPEKAKHIALCGAVAKRDDARVEEFHVSPSLLASPALQQFVVQPLASLVSELDGGKRDEDECGVIILDHTLSPPRRSRLAELVASTLPSTSGHVAVTAHLLLDSAHVEYEIRATGVSVSVAGGKRWNHAQVSHMLATLLKRCVEERQWVVLALCLQVELVAGGPHHATRRELEACSVEASKALCTLIQSCVSKMRQAVPVDRASAFHVSVATTDASPEALQMPRSDVQLQGGKVLAWQGGIVVDGKRCCAAVRLVSTTQLADRTATASASDSSIREVGAVHLTLWCLDGDSVFELELPAALSLSLVSSTLMVAFTASPLDVGHSEQADLHGEATRRLQAWLQAHLRWNPIEEDGGSANSTLTVRTFVDVPSDVLRQRSVAKAWSMLSGAAVVTPIPPDTASSAVVSARGSLEQLSAEILFVTSTLRGRCMHKAGFRTTHHNGVGGAATCLASVYHCSGGGIAAVYTDPDTSATRLALIRSTSV